MAHQLPKLPYAFNALEPHIDTKTMEIHYGKHHQAYIDNLNRALEKFPDLINLEIRDLLADTSKIPDEIRQTVINNGGGHFNHTFFWSILKPSTGKSAEGNLLTAINTEFGTFDNFKEEFKKAALARFGSGWVWLVKDKDNLLKIMTTPNQDSPISEGYSPILALDVWEHAYYLNYQNKRGDYVDAFWNIVNWDKVTEILETY